MTKKDKIYNALLLLMPFILFMPQYISNQVIAWLDFSLYFLPFRMLTADYIQHGIMPFWNPYIYCGNPLMANMQSAVFYPLNIFFHVLPAITAVKITTYITFSVMSLFTYAFMRIYKASEEGGFIAAVVFAFGFYSMIKAVEFAEINVMAWIPAALYFTKKFADSAKARDFFMIPFMLCLSLLGGHAQLFIYAWLLFTAFYIFENIYMKKGGRAEGVKNFLIINLILLGLSAIQLLPAARFVLLSKRAATGIGYENVMGGFLSFDHILSFIFPFLSDFFSPQANFLNWFGLINTGIFPIMLMILGAVMIKDTKLKNFLMISFTFFLLLTFLGWMPFYKAMFDMMPFLSAVKYQSKTILGLFFIMCLLFARGFDELFSRPKEELKSFVMFSMLAFGSVLAAYLFADIFRNNILFLYKKIFEPNMNFQKVYDLIASYDIILFKFLVYVIIFAFVVLIIYVVGKEIRRGTAMKTAAVIVTLAGLFIFQRWGSFQYFKSDFLVKKTKQVDFMVNKSLIGQLRILAPAIFNRFDYVVHTMTQDELMYYSVDTLAPNFPMCYGIKNVDGFDSLFLGDFASFKSCFNVTGEPWNMPAFSLFSAKYITSKAKLTGPSLRLVSAGYTDIYENTNYLEPAFLISDPFETVIVDKLKAGKIISSRSFNPLKTLILEKPVEGLKGINGRIKVAGSSVTKQVSFDMRDPNTYLVRTNCATPGVLVVTDNYYPGWKAYIDGVETKIMKVDMTFKGIFLTAGKHEVYFKYSPPEFFIGALISIVLLILMIPLVPVLLAIF